MNKKALLAIFILLAGIQAAVQLAAQDARVVEISGSVELQNAGQEWKPASVGAVIEKDSVVSTGIKSSAVISLGASNVTVGPLSMLSLEELTQRDGTEEAVLYLRTGRIRADVTPPAGMQAEFTVRSPTTTASVRGTSFSFNGKRLHVHSGRVQLANNNSGQKLYVGKNQHSYSDAGRNGKLIPHFDSETSVFHPTLPDYTNTGSGRNRPQTASTPPVTIDVTWQ